VLLLMRRRGGEVAATVVDFVFVFVFCFHFCACFSLVLVLFLLLCANEVMVSHLFPATDIGMMALSVTAAVVFGAVLQQVETKMAPTTMTVVMTNEMHHSAPYTLPSNPCPRESKGKGNEGKGGGHHRGRRW
jgi:hypothetical protein